MASLAQRLAAAQHSSWLVRALALRWRARPSALCARPAGSRAGGTPRQPHRRYRGQPERQERRNRGRPIDPIGSDAAKKVKGKKRPIIVDTLGLMLGLDVTPADVQDRDGFLPLLKSVRRMFGFLERLLADGAYSGTKTAAAAKRTGQVVLEIVKRSDAAKGFVVVAKRWIVERTFGWLGRCRRLAKDVENLTRTQLAFVQLAMIRLMTRRVARLCQSS
jgi:transposase